MAGKSLERRFSASPQRLYEACRRAVATSGYSVLHSDPTALTISFNTGRSMKSWGGQDLSASVFGDGSGSKVVIGGSLARGGMPGGGSQVFAWGEKGALSNKFLDAVAHAVPRVPEPAAQPSATGDLSTQLATLVSLHAGGGLTDREFADAKASLISKGIR